MAYTWLDVINILHLHYENLDETVYSNETKD